MTSTASVPALYRMAGRSPPGPFRCGSTTWSAKPAATAASTAFPPGSRAAMPVAVASQCVDVTTPNVPRISGRVVKSAMTMRLPWPWRRPHTANDAPPWRAGSVARPGATVQVDSLVHLGREQAEVEGGQSDGGVQAVLIGAIGPARGVQARERLDALVIGRDQEIVLQAGERRV